MFWLFPSLVSAFSKAGERLFHRKIMLTCNCYVYNFVYNVIGTLFFIPLLMLFGLQISYVPYAWMLIAVASAIYVITGAITFESYKHAEVSLREPIGSIRLIIVYVLSLIFLSEQFTFGRLAGTLLIMAALATMSFKDGKLNLKDKGIYLTIIGGILSGITPIFEKYLLNYFNPLSLAFLLFLFPALGCILFLKGRGSDLKFITSGKMKYFVLSSSFLCFVGYTARIWAYSLADVSLVFPIFSLSSVLASVLGIWILKERSDIGKKILGVLLAFAGAVLVSV